MGVHFNQHLNWNDHVTNLVKSTCGVLRTLRLFKIFTPFKVRKNLAECLVLSKLNYGNVVFAQLPHHLINRLQRVQNTAAGYVLGRYAKLKDVIELNWLPIKEKLSHRSLYANDWPKYLLTEINQPKSKRIAMQNDYQQTIRLGEPKTFNEQCRAFNNLPKNLRMNTNFKMKVRNISKIKH